MKRDSKFSYEGQKYQFIDWADDGSAHCINLALGQECWLSGVARTASLQRQQESERRTAELEGRARKTESENERYRREAFSLFVTHPAMQKLAEDELERNSRNCDDDDSAEE